MDRGEAWKFVLLDVGRILVFTVIPACWLGLGSILFNGKPNLEPGEDIAGLFYLVVGGLGYIGLIAWGLR